MQQVKKVLIVDDDVELTNMYGIKFKLAGWEVKSSHDGISGLREFSSFKPDIMLLDVMMPGLDGFQTLTFVVQKAKAEKIPCKVVMFTNLSGVELEKKAKLSGASFLVKANTNPREALEYVTALLSEQAVVSIKGEVTTEINEKDGKFIANCPSCGKEMEVMLDVDGKPSKLVMKNNS